LAIDLVSLARRLKKSAYRPRSILAYNLEHQLMFIIVPLPVFSFLCPSGLHSSSSSIHPLLLPNTLLPLLLSSTSAYYLRRRTLPPSKIVLNRHFGRALDLSVSLRDPTANIHDKKVLHLFHILVSRLMLSESPHSFVQITPELLLADLLGNLALSFRQFQRPPLNVWCFSQLHLRQPCYQTAEATNSPPLKIRPHRNYGDFTHQLFHKQ